MIETLEQLEAYAITKNLLVAFNAEANGDRGGYLIYDTYRLENQDNTGPLFGWDIPTAVELIDSYQPNANQVLQNIKDGVK